MRQIFFLTSHGGVCPKRNDFINGFMFFPAVFYHPGFQPFIKEFSFSKIDKNQTASQL